MADFVEKSIQEMIPEFEEIEQMKLLNEEELKRLIQKRRDFEYKLFRKTKQKSNYMDYILYDVKLLDLLNIRKKKLGIEDIRKIEFPLVKRIHRRFRFVTKLWCTHEDVWDLRLAFAKKHEYKSEVSLVYAEKAKFLSNDEQVFISWANYEVSERRNFEAARSVLVNRALLLHPKSITLATECFRLELLYIEYLILKRKQEEKKEDMKQKDNLYDKEKTDELIENCEIPKLIYESFSQKLNDSKLLVSFYSVAKEFENAQKLTQQIYDDCICKYPNDASMWLLKAKRAVEEIMKELPDDKSEHEVLMIKVNKILEVFSEAFDCLKDTFSGTYLKECLCLLKMCWGKNNLKETIMNHMKDSFSIHKDQCSSAELYTWFLLKSNSNASDEEQLDVLNLALKRSPFSQMIKFDILKLKCNQAKNQKQILKVFSSDYQNMCDDYGVESWKLVSSLVTGNNRTNLLQKSIAHIDRNIAKEMKIHYLKEAKDIIECRKIFSHLKSSPPYDTALVGCMLQKELQQERVSVQHCRLVLDDAVYKLGTTEYGLWLAYIHFERVHGDPLKANILTTSALDKLNSSKVDQFNTIKMIIEHLLDEASNKSSLKSYIEDESTMKTIVKSPKGSFDYMFDSSEEEKTLPELLQEIIQSQQTLQEEAQPMLHRKTRVIQSKTQSKHNHFMEDVLKTLIGERVPLKVKEVKVNKPNLEKDSEKLLKDMKADDQLLVTKSQKLSINIKSDIEKILKTSKTLSPGFIQQKQVLPYYLGKYASKRVKKKEKNKTAGSSWFEMSAPEKTPEILRDIALLKNRSILNKNVPYKNNLKHTPKYFQMGTVLDSSVDFYSSRVPRKQRRKTMLEGIMNEEEVIGNKKLQSVNIPKRGKKRKSKRKKNHNAKKNKVI